jgi:hypothetical protein
MNDSKIIKLSDVVEDKMEINHKCIMMLNQALVSIVRLQVLSEDYLADALPIEQLKLMEENVAAILEEAEKWQEDHP